MASLGKAIGATSALEGQPQTHQHLVSTQPTSPGALFMLPPELRREIYKGLLPPRKIVKARGAYNYPGRPKKWTFYSLNAVSQPLLTQLCKETRDFILQKGTFIFNDGKEEGGLWWDPENDVLVFDTQFDPQVMPFAFEGLEGLEHVKNICLYAHQAMYVALRVQYKSQGLAFPASEIAQLKKVELIFRDTANDAMSDDKQHFMTKYFAHVHTFQVLFHDLWPRRKLSFNLHSVWGEERVRKQLQKFHKLWEDLYDTIHNKFNENFWLAYNDRHLEDFRGDSVALVYYDNPDIAEAQCKLPEVCAYDHLAFSRPAGF